MRKLLVSMLVGIVAVGTLLLFRQQPRREQQIQENVNVQTAAVNSQPEQVPQVAARSAPSNPPSSAGAEQPAIGLPKAVNLAVPFTSQAPHANWSLPYQEACEEAAALMVHWYWEQGKSSGKAGSGSAGQKAKSKSRDEADAGIVDLVAFQNERYGFYKDTDGEETARFIRDRWDHAADVVYDPTVTMIKQELADGYPVIVLAAGRQLKNPNYTPPGPLYHALVIKGYTAEGMFITNDPGTRRGADYQYKPSVLMNALHEWNDGDVAHGRKVMLVVRGQE